ncbi:MAG TPA: PEP-CTERM sorting domain-containing protein [Gemmataceae bacterium]|nr:PEP-CTERM sorting domain-containing protein [Gemmataceae bacterium]
MKRFLCGLVALAVSVGVTETAKGQANYVYTPIEVPGVFNTIATGINNAGQVVGYYVVNGAAHGFLLNRGVFTTVDVPGFFSTEAYGINDIGQIVGYCSNPGPRQTDQGFLFSGGSFTTVNRPGASFTHFGGINNLGQIVGDSANGGFLMSGGTFTSLPFPGSGINNLGQIVGGNYLLSGGNLTQINGGAAGINDFSQIVGGEVSTGFLLTGGQYVTLSVPGSIQTVATGINNAGEIVGSYRDANGEFFGFFATPNLSPLPEPSTFLLLGISTLGVIAWTRHRRSSPIHGSEDAEGLIA